MKEKLPKPPKVIPMINVKIIRRPWNIVSSFNDAPCDAVKCSVADLISHPAIPPERDAKTETNVYRSPTDRMLQENVKLDM